MQEKFDVDTFTDTEITITKEQNTLREKINLTLNRQELNLNLLPKKHFLSFHVAS